MRRPSTPDGLPSAICKRGRQAEGTRSRHAASLSETQRRADVSTGHVTVTSHVFIPSHPKC